MAIRQNKIKIKEIGFDDYLESEMAVEPEYLNFSNLPANENLFVALEKALEGLPPEQKQCIELFFIKNKSYKEIVELTGFDNNKVKSYIQNGKRNLKLFIEGSVNTISILFFYWLLNF